ncbi:hypothetical protein [Poriferisphaera sp. WC338]|uniref:hypothetical protein n=1 Tax=Poriferisphaera sp. WC338 TaxID=3425129 RepID=UPI003D816109
MGDKQVETVDEARGVKASDYFEQHKAEAKSRVVRFWRRFFFVMGGLVLLVVIAFVGWHVYLNHQLDQQLVELRAAGHPVGIDELEQRYADFDEENLADYLEPVLGRLHDASKEIKERYGKHADDMPDDVESMKGAVPVLTAAPIDWYRNHQTPPGLLLDAMGRLLDEHREDIETLLDLPDWEARYPIDFSEGIMTELPHLAELRNAARVLQLYHWEAIHRGQPADGIRALVAMRQLAESIKDEPVLITQLVRVSIHRLLQVEIERALNLHVYDDGQLAVLYALVEPFDIGVAVTMSFEGELVWTQYEIEWMKRDPARIKELLTSEAPAFIARLQKYAGLLTRDQMLVADYYGRMLEDIQRGNWDMQPYDDEAEQYGLLSMYARIFLPAITACARTNVQYHRLSVMTRLAIAVERYRLAKGELPEGLDVLVPRYMAALPVDQYYSVSGVLGEAQAYGLVTHGAGYVVYHPGRDMVDNEGMPAAKGEGIGGSDGFSDLSIGVDLPRVSGAEQEGVLLALYPEVEEEKRDDLRYEQVQYLNYVSPVTGDALIEMEPYQSADEDLFLSDEDWFDEDDVMLDGDVLGKDME